MSSVVVDPGKLQELFKEISEIDQTLAAASGSETAGKRNIATQAMKSTEDVWKGPVDQIVNWLKTDFNGNDEQLVGAYTALIRNVRDAVRKQVDKYLDDAFKEHKTDTPTVKLTEEQIEQMIASRKKAKEHFDVLYSVLEMAEIDLSDVQVPPRLAGARGPRGPRVLKGYDFFVDGKPRSEKTNNLSSIAATVWPKTKVKDLKDFLLAQGLDLENPPDEFEYDLPTEPNSTKLRGVKGALADEVGEDDEDEDEDSVSEEDDEEV